MAANRRTHATLTLMALVSLMTPAAARSDSLAPETIKSLLTSQPDHVADYKFTVDGKDFSTRVGIQGAKMMFADLSDTAADGRPNSVIIRDAAGTTFLVRPREKTYSVLRAWNDSPLVDLGGLFHSVMHEGGAITGESKGSSSVDGHATIKLELKVASTSIHDKFSLQTAPDLRHLVVRLHRRGARTYAHSLSQISLDPPESLFTIPAEFAKVEAAQSFAVGSVQVGFVPYSDAEAVPKTPVATTMVLVREGSDVESSPETKYEITKPDGSFEMALQPGTYKLVRLEFSSPSLSPNPVRVPTGGPKLTVPDIGCAYVGKLFFVYFRLPPSDLEAQTRMVQEIVKKRGSGGLFVFLNSGGLVVSSMGVELSDADEHEAGKGPCRVVKATF